MEGKAPKRSLMSRYLDGLERLGNKMPHPFMLFTYFAISVILLSGLLSWLGVHAIHPQTGDRVEIFNLLSGPGIERIFSTMVSNFTGFAPLGLVLVIMLSIGMMDRLGLLANILKGIVLSVPRPLITITLVFASVISSVASDAGYVVLIPLGAALFASMGRHPIAGLAAAFAGVAGGFGANLIFTPGDALLAGISEEAAHTLDPYYQFNILGNWYFMIASTVLLTLVGAWVTEKIVEPRLGAYKSDKIEKVGEISALEKKGMRAAGIATIVTAALLSLLVVPSWGPLRGDASIVASPFFRNLVPILFIFFLVIGIVYGVVTKQIKKSTDVIDHFVATVSDMSTYIVLVFMASQFVAFFGQSNLGIILAINGGEFLSYIGFTGFGLILAYMFLSAFVNLFMGSASAQWLLFSPIFIPMFMQLGFTPEFTQLAYRVGDSITNPVSPLLSYLALIITFAQKYDKKAGMGTMVSTMMPYTIFFGIFWVILLFLWMQFNLPIGPGSYIFL